MKAELAYKVEDGYRLRELMLTVCKDDDTDNGSMRDVRRKRILRLLQQAKEQGYSLSYKDLNLILLISPATLKRDISYLRKQGIEVAVKKGRGYERQR